MTYNKNTGYPDKNFGKLNIIDFVDAFATISKSPQLNVILWVLNNLDYENKYTGTMQEITDNTGVSYKTVQNTFNAMCDKDIMRVFKNCYVFNPRLLMKGPTVHYNNMMTNYNTLSRIKPSRTRKN
jgi:hypothetical protein